MATMAKRKNLRELGKKDVFTTGEAAELCNVSQQTIIRCFDAGRLGGFRVPGSRFRRIPRSELLRFMRANNMPADVLDDDVKRILVVDDDEQIIDLYRDVFRGDGRFRLKTAGTGYDAGILTQEFRPHLILLDYMLPDVNGNVVCERIRARPEFGHTKIVIVSGVVNEDEIQGLLDAGADDFVKKPFDLNDLLQRITRLLDLEAPAK